MTESPMAGVDALVRLASMSRLISYSHIGEDNVVLQIGRVVYALNREQAVALLTGALNSLAGADRGRFEVA